MNFFSIGVLAISQDVMSLESSENRTFFTIQVHVKSKTQGSIQVSKTTISMEGILEDKLQTHLDRHC